MYNGIILWNPMAVHLDSRQCFKDVSDDVVPSCLRVRLCFFFFPSSTPFPFWFLIACGSKLTAKRNKHHLQKFLLSRAEGGFLFVCFSLTFLSHRENPPNWAKTWWQTACRPDSACERQVFFPRVLKAGTNCFTLSCNSP